jgi:CheY-like chemotaxis protein
VQAAEPSRWNLLLAEDNLPDVLLVRGLIRDQNLPLNVFTASDGQQAIDFIAGAEHDADFPCPHVLLVDLNLPKADGFEVLERLRASDRCSNATVLVISSSDSESDRNRAAQLGAGYFRKPSSYEEFSKLGGILRQLLERK